MPRSLRPAVLCKFNPKSETAYPPAQQTAHQRASSMFTADQKKQNSKVGPKVAKEATVLPRQRQKAKGLHHWRRLKMAPEPKNGTSA